MSNWRRRGRFWAGAVCALLVSWLAFAIIVAVAALLISRFAWGFWLAVPLSLVSFFGVFFGVAFVCTFFWVPVADSKKILDWGAWTVLLILTPFLAGGVLAFLLLILLFPLTLVAFHVGAERGEEWWKHRRWRHFVGLANDYEREDEL